MSWWQEKVGENGETNLDMVLLFGFAILIVCILMSAVPLYFWLVSIKG